MSDSALSRRGWLLRLSPSWRAPALALLVERPLAFVLVLWLLVAGTSVLFAARGDADAALAMSIYLILILALGLGNGIVSRDRAGSRWLLLFQRQGTPLAHYSRSFAVTLALVVGLYGLWLGTTAIVLARNGVGDGGAFLSEAVTGTLWSVVLLSVLVGISSLVDGYDAAIVTVWFFLALVYRRALLALDAPLWLIDGLYYVLLPVDAIPLIGAWVRGASSAPPASAWMHVVGTVVAWLALAAWCIRRRSDGDAA